VTIQDLDSKLRTIFERAQGQDDFIAGAGALRYRDIIQVIDAAKGAGVEKVGIVTEGMRKAGGRDDQGQLASDSGWWLVAKNTGSGD